MERRCYEYLRTNRQTASQSCACTRGIPHMFITCYMRVACSCVFLSVHLGKKKKEKKRTIANEYMPFTDAEGYHPPMCIKYVCTKLFDSVWR
ncbi:hypothetical protein PVIIG_00675 [Plasmodium vivax India VII]|uniref:Uncharacterized protein n=5 Tax=Plasmodium vivax TaxID=5855 RepID=A5JZM8_PLAVS|nr:hypothetical protein PVX_123015 [Plasmodium vivax]KMZ77988.1 hypothetical protein PVIIG_00675 [Plasmodium vivax India VII]KMZ84328.1 hypothetical protein PVBG_00108 [Plasmodium vivax Brazil I]KMZ90108.1 hypothetical protein PVMG_01475 [Plasmodium vivax Mauritania I]KMZ97215.1 hypothetical protein PVNG_00242 [Plasmodium vivax North Korean]EDL47439.1 hypothetical protein PVX_123015 [Plasmodium vivax]|eukprot:XP_001617166.1 hypothetical protein [Plasmodium vivax Sal-1]